MKEQEPILSESLPETLTIQDVKEIMRIGMNAAYNLIHSKSFPVIKVGHAYRIPKRTPSTSGSPSRIP